jgi:hypothetical protein
MPLRAWVPYVGKAKEVAVTTPRLRLVSSGLAGLLSALAGLALAACSDLAKTTDVDLSEQRGPITGEQDTPRTIGTQPSGAFAVKVEVAGSLRPGSNVEVTALIDPLVPVENVVAAVFAPEVEYVKATGPGSDYRVPQDFSGPAVKSVDETGRMRGRMTLNASVQIDHPGAYEIIVKVVGESLVDDPRISEDVRRSVWVYISEDGGSVSEGFEPTRLPDGTIKAPGPRRELATAAPSKGGAAPSMAPADWNTVTVHMYYNDGSTPTPVQGALVKLYEYVDTWGGELWDLQWGVTDANGNVTFSCYAWHVVVEPTLSGSELWMNWSWGTTNYVCAQGVPTLDVNVGSSGNVFNNYENDIIPTVDAFLNDSRSNVHVHIDGNPSSNSRYKSYPVIFDDIYISVNHIWSRGTQAHEYGHAIHEKGLGGFTTHDCPAQHTYTLRTDYDCAWVEGFAEFIATATGYRSRSPSGYVNQHCLVYNFTTHSCTTPGTVDDHLMVEGAVTEFLWDLVDSGNSETYDNVTMAGMYVADIVETCTVDYSRPRRIHYLIHCIERRISGYSNGFPAAEQPSTFSVSSGHSVDADEVTRLWLWHFFNSEPGEPPPPPLDPLVVTIGGNTEVKPNQWCAWWAGSITGGPGPYQYQWYKNSSQQGTGSDVIIYTDNASFWVRLDVTSTSTGQEGTKSIWVTNTSSAEECFQ